MSIWDATRYGFSPVYWLQIAGVPVIFAERETGLTLPSGYTVEDGSLSIDKSAEVGVEQVDRDTGTAVSLSLGFKLLDTGTVRSWLRRWSRKMTLTADLSATGTAITVDDTTGWSNGDAAYLGMERVTITTVASGTSCTGLARATVGTLAYDHKTGTSGQIITDTPRYWRGRDVILYASPCDANGYCTGTNLLDDAVMVWRGRIEEGPIREVDGFAFEASSLDRVLDRGLVGSITGTIVDTDSKAAVSKGWTAQITLRAKDSALAAIWAYDFQVQPFKLLADGDLLNFAQIRDLFIDGFADAVSAESAGADVGTFKWSGSKNYEAHVSLTADASIRSFEVYIYFNGHDVVTDWIDKPNGWGGGNFPLGLETTGNPLTPLNIINPLAQSGMTLKISEGNPSDIPATGTLRVKSSAKTVLLSYEAVATGGVYAYFTGLAAPPGTPKTIPGEYKNAECEVVFKDEGTFPAMMLRALMSSGNGERSATYDTLVRGQGYGLHEDWIKADSYTAASDPIGTLQGEVASGGQTFADLFGGALGLFRKAIVCRPDTSEANHPLKLTLVDTAPMGCAYVTTITDTDLLSDQGDPVLSVKRAHAPTVLHVTRPHIGGSDAADSLVFVDAPSIDAAGRDEVEYTVPAKTLPSLYKAAGPAATSHLAADQTTQAIELRVGPWIVAEVGDTIWVDSTHPALWTWSSSPGEQGYTGGARVLGRRIELLSTAVVLTLLADSAISATALSPSASVEGYDVAAAPTYIDIPLGPGNGYLLHMQQALTDAGANIWLQHYTAGGTETTTQLHEVSAAAENGGLCRLTIASTSGGHSLSLAAATPSHLTLPTTSGGKVSTWQGNFAHRDDGTTWG